MPAKGENSSCLYKNGESRIVIIDSEEELIAKEDGWADSPARLGVTVKTDKPHEQVAQAGESPTEKPREQAQQPEETKIENE